MRSTLYRENSGPHKTHYNRYRSRSRPVPDTIKINIIFEKKDQNLTMINHILIQDRFLQSVYHQVNKSPDNNHNYGEHT